MNRIATTTALMAFVRSAELGSFAAAARQLGMSPAAVGQTVRRLEDGFGVKLLQRSTRRMRITDDGRILLERCRGLVAELEAIDRVFEESRGVVSGPLRVSAPAGLARRYALPLVARFLAEHPQVEVSLDCSDAVRDVAAGEVDVAFRILRPTDSAVITRRLARIDAVTVASAAYLRRHGTPKHPRELASHRCVLYRHPVSGALSPMFFSVHEREVTVTPPAGLVVNDVDTGCDAAVMGLGIAQPPASYVETLLATKRLVRILEPFRTAPWTLYLCYAGSKHAPRRVRAFVQLALRVGLP